ncbi:4Fe-4S dicluster domain-containing protein [Aeromonas hydrophila]|uniref:4Fe-4S dicluster domain-containing protein n=1 Tax=Aeromonas hydrophila TaxID=644 RepID=UPI001A28FB09|nr:4Fe-4S binding protein [Aeromonas hydrophila]MCP3288669.1 4Fe-4S binding protein [Aeromonas hydrophila]HAU4891841.1 4Fe-4S dicluster domain-containing protein [Aeromonas hydrophila]HAU4973184.1 4Fe-4S dicluster domain-containing protein [Aeromonas hydrophila]HAU4982307.1 4Fe-4S dicluster domain-containing protein [Aeromonas hydrophila]HDX8385709.1 4Fe-4S binding protein [Aeromonas hydrophila]
MSIEQPITTSVATLTADGVAARNERARAHALQHTVKTDNLIPATVSYQSQGRLLLVGPEDRIRRAASLLPQGVMPTLLVTESVFDAEAADVEAIFEATAALGALTLREPSLSGYLGQFQLTGLNGQGERISLAALCFPQQATMGSEPRFDLVADLGRVPLFALERPPVGYLSFSDDTDLAERLAELCALTGIFDKPRYFRLDPEACAFTARGVPGCSRCLDVCPTDALKPVNGRIQIDPHLCQGFGSCASACPTGAIGYHQPDANTSGDYLLRLLKHYREAGGDAPQLLIAGESEREWVETELTRLPANWLPVWVEESASLGIESWFAALAYGASAVRIVLGDDAPASVRALVERELASAAVLLAGAGLSADRIALFNPDVELDKPISGQPALALLDKPLKGDKRENLFAAFDALWQANEGRREPLAVPHGAPYGSVELKEADCTLCMGCVAVCPSRALHAVGHTPGLNFIEQDCIQCGMCEKACPEQAIVLMPRLQPVPEARRAVQSLKAEEAACCIRCAKPFAPASLIRRIQQKLAGHSHFQNEAAQRLLMCEECRVKDVFAALAADPVSQLKV